MTIDRDGRDWGQARLEWTKDEFQLAPQRRLVKADVGTVESQLKADTNGASRGQFLAIAASDRNVSPGPGRECMLITYRRTGGPFAMLTFAAIAIVAMLTAAVAAAVLIVAGLVAAPVSLLRAVLPRSWRHRTVPLARSG